MRRNLKNFELKAVCSLDDPELKYIKDVADPKTGNTLRLGYKLLKTGTSSFTAKNLPTVIGNDGLPWDLGCYYLVYLTVHQLADPASIQKYAVHLSEYYDFCNAEDVAPLLDSPSKRKKPIFRFRDRLIASVRDGEITDKTANNKIGNVVRFFRWLVEDHGYVFKHPPFSNESMFISYTKASGNVGYKLIRSHDARIKTFPKSMLPSENTLIDDGRLRPLTPIEQEALLDILANSKNTEMVLILIFALTTGARIQSTLTLRHKHFRVEIDPESSVPLGIGHGTSVDSKYSKKQVLIIPSFIQRKLAIYSHSERSKARFHKYCEVRGIVASETVMEECYLFLTNRGHPLYDAKSDFYTFDPSQERSNLRIGDGVRKFINQHVLPSMKKKFGDQYHFQVHDLRATFGMNLVDACNRLVNNGEMGASEVLPFVQSRMNHTDSKTTESYIHYRERNRQAEQIIENYQDTLLDRISAVLGGINV